MLEHLQDLKRLFNSAKVNHDSKTIQDLRRIAMRIVSNEFGNKPSYECELTHKEIEIGQNEGKIACIKAHRTRTYSDLKTSKDTVERVFKQWGYEFNHY